MATDGMISRKLNLAVWVAFLLMSIDTISRVQCVPGKTVDFQIYFQKEQRDMSKSYFCIIVLNTYIYLVNWATI